MMQRKWAMLVGCLTAGAVACGGSDDESTNGDAPGGTSGDDDTSFGSPGDDLGYAGGGGSAGPSAPGFASAEADFADPQAPDNEGDNYEAVGTNPYTMVAHDPLSTFAADVDTASYDIFVRDIQGGILPQPDSVRLEEFVNFFDYDYPAPASDAAEPFAIHLAAAPSILDNGTTTLRVGIQGADPPPEEKRPANLVFLIDVSGSMSSQDKLPLVQLVLTETLNVLESTDTISIVTYAGSTRVAMEPTPVSQRSAIESMIQSFNAGGSTAGASGINLAYQQAEAGFIEGGINHIILCTDGDFNVGTSSTDELVTLIEDKRKTGVTFTALGFGSGNLNDAMMEAISNKGNGIYGVINSDQQARQYVEERMLSSLNLIAKDMKIQVEFNRDHVLAYRLLGYENRAIEDHLFRDDTIDAGEIGAGHQVTALYEVVLTGGAIPEPAGAPAVVDGAAFADAVEVAPDDLVLVKVRYKDVDATETDPAYEVSASLTPSDVATTLDAADGDLQWATAIAAFAEILKESPYADAGHLGTIDVVVDANVGTDGHRIELAAHLDTALPLLSP